MIFTAAEVFKKAELGKLSWISHNEEKNNLTGLWYMLSTSMISVLIHTSSPCEYHAPCPDKSFLLYFTSFEGGIANAISSFKWRKIFLFVNNNITRIELFDWLIIHTKNLFDRIKWYFYWFKMAWDLSIYTCVAGQGSTIVLLRPYTGEHRYNTIAGIQWVKSCYKWIMLYNKINEKTISKTDE